jgi:hypothetical protein
LIEESGEGDERDVRRKSREVEILGPKENAGVDD